MLKLLSLPFRLVWWLLVITTPVLAVWLASSLAIYSNGPTWLAISVGALLFPGVPLLWDAWATKRFEAKQTAREEADKERRDRFLSFGDRLVLRTLFVNLIFVAVLLGAFPERAFTALSTRGDWPLEYAQPSEQVEQTREVMFAMAGGLEGLHNMARENPYATEADSTDETVPEADEIGEVAVVDETTKPEKPEDPAVPDGTKPADGEPAAPDVPEPPKTPTDGASWPLPNELHPLVVNMPEEQKTSAQAVAKYIAANESDPFLRVKAMHDFVADRIAYDLSTSGVKQDANSTFERKTGVCEGYARLLVEMGRDIPEEIVYVPGVSRGIGGEISGGGHAWNAAKIKGKWYLIDPTWNAGFYNGGVFKKEYRTDYLFTPPEIFGVDHLPDNERWQLMPEPITRGEFMRRPMMRTGFYREGLVLLEPDRSQISVGETATMAVANPRRRKVIANLVQPSTGAKVSDCDLIPGRERERIECKVPSSGTYQIQLFAGDPKERTFPFVGQIEVVR